MITHKKSSFCEKKDRKGLQNIFRCSMKPSQNKHLQALGFTLASVPTLCAVFSSVVSQLQIIAKEKGTEKQWRSFLFLLFYRGVPGMHAGAIVYASFSAHCNISFLFFVLHSKFSFQPKISKIVTNFFIPQNLPYPLSYFPHHVITKYTAQISSFYYMLR